MFGGKIAEYDEIELFVEQSLSGSASATPNSDYTAGYGGVSRIKTYYQTKFNQPFAEGIVQTIDYGYTTNIGGGGTASNSVTLEVPLLSISETRTTGTESKVILEGVKLYAMNALSAGNEYWLLECDNLKWYVDGVLEYTHGSFSVDTNDGLTYNPYLTISNIPLIGLPPIVDSAPESSGPGTAFVGTAYPSGSATADLTTTARFRWKVGGTWYTEPVNLSVMATPSLTCSYPVADAPTITVTNTGDLEIETHSETTVTGYSTYSIGSGENNSANICLMPGRASNVNRVDPDNYRAVWYRYGLPQAKETGSRTCAKLDLPKVTTSNTVSNVVVSEADEFLDVVTGDPAYIEDQLAETIYTPYNIGMSGSLIDNSPTGDIGTQNILLTFPEGMTWPSPYITHHKHTETSEQWLTDICNYYVYRGNPLWHYFLFPADEDSAGLAWDDYYSKIRSQWLGYSSIEETQRIGSRNHILLESVQESGWTPFVDFHTSLGPTTWVGISRWHQDNPTVPTSVTLDSGSEDRWTADLDGDGSTGDDCTLTFGSGGVTAAPIGGATTLHFQFDLGDFDVEPWMYPHICREIEVGWSATNMTSCKVELVGVDDEVVTLTDNVEGKFSWPLTGTADKYADTATLDYGLGVVTDTGTDLIGADTISSTVFGSDSERFFAPGLLPGRTAKWLRFTCVVTGAVTIDWPIFYAPANNDTYRPVPVATTGQMQVVASPNGPGTTYGHLSNWDYDLDVFAHDWLVRDPGQKMSTLDWLCYRRFVWEAKDCEDGLDTEIAGLYDNPNEYTLRKHLARDPLLTTQYTSATLMPLESKLIGAAMVNTLSELPPIGMFPHWDRDGDYEQTTDFSKDVWSWVQGPSRTVCDSALHTFKLTADQWTLAETPGVTGWTIASHEHAVSASDDVDDFRGRTLSPDKDWFKALPWRGWFAILGVGVPDTAGCVSYDVGVDMFHARAYTSDDGLYTGLCDNTIGAWSDTLQAITADWVAIRVDRFKGRKFHLLTEESGSVKYYTSTDGVTYTLSTTIATGTKPTAAVSPDGRLFVYWIDSGAVKGVIYDNSGATLKSTFTAVGTVDDAGIDAECSVTGSGTWRIVLVCVVSGSVTQYTSTDGFTFS